jgi:hypothetical protein
VFAGFAPSEHHNPSGGELPHTAKDKFAMRFHHIAPYIRPSNHRLMMAL